VHPRKALRGGIQKSILTDFWGNVGDSRQMLTKTSQLVQERAFDTPTKALLWAWRPWWLLSKEYSLTHANGFLNPQLSTLNPNSETRNSKPEARNPKKLKLETRNPKPERCCLEKRCAGFSASPPRQPSSPSHGVTRNPKPGSRNLSPETRGPKPRSRNPAAET